jgi:hypothetical protein
MALNGRVNNELGRKWSWPNLRYPVTDETSEYLGSSLSLTPPSFEFETFLIQVRSVSALFRNTPLKENIQ